MTSTPSRTRHSSRICAPFIRMGSSAGRSLVWFEAACLRLRHRPAYAGRCKPAFQSHALQSVACLGRSSRNTARRSPRGAPRKKENMYEGKYAGRAERVAGSRVARVRSRAAIPAVSRYSATTARAAERFHSRVRSNRPPVAGYKKSPSQQGTGRGPRCHPCSPPHAVRTGHFRSAITGAARFGLRRCASAEGLRGEFERCVPPGFHSPRLAGGATRPYCSPSWPPPYKLIAFFELTSNRTGLGCLSTASARRAWPAPSIAG